MAGRYKGLGLPFVNRDCPQYSPRSFGAGRLSTTDCPIIGENTL